MDQLTWELTGVAMALLCGIIASALLYNYLQNRRRLREWAKLPHPSLYEGAVFQAPPKPPSTGKLVLALTLFIIMVVITALAVTYVPSVTYYKL